MTALCARPGCDLPEDEHHAFVATKVPDRCKCDPREWWVRPIPDVCAAYDAHPLKGCGCKTCQHMPECHPPKAETATEKESPTT